VEALTTAIQETIQDNIAKTKPRPDAKRWWSGDLGRERKKLNRLRTVSFRYRALADHPSHKELRLRSNQYREAIIQAKRHHWYNYLEEMTAADLWTANKFIREPVGDGGCHRIPTLKVRRAGKYSLTTTRTRPRSLPSFSFRHPHCYQRITEPTITQSHCQTPPRSTPDKYGSRYQDSYRTRPMARMASQTSYYKGASTLSSTG
jgi:hypothetical protein